MEEEEAVKGVSSPPKCMQLSSCDCGPVDAMHLDN